ncbi:MAG TPA: type II toxin-antitoxin system RelE/ParE family toxin [Planctomycetes bacterium]|nr:type II toxin-antitoxin system RelE/ParE family toxin [Planctomycetota bacterium]
MAYEVILAPRALQDLEEIVRYIAMDNPVIAAQFGKGLIEKARSAGALPRSGRIVPEFQLADIRELIAGPYRIVYRVNDPDRSVEIVRFWHAARGTPKSVREGD